MRSGSAATITMTRESEGEEEKWQTRRGCWWRKVRKAAAAAWVEDREMCSWQEKSRFWQAQKMTVFGRIGRKKGVFGK